MKDPVKPIAVGFIMLQRLREIEVTVIDVDNAALKEIVRVGVSRVITVIDVEVSVVLPEVVTE